MRGVDDVGCGWWYSLVREGCRKVGVERSDMCGSVEWRGRASGGVEKSE